MFSRKIILVTSGSYSRQIVVKKFSPSQQTDISYVKQQNSYQGISCKLSVRHQIVKILQNLSFIAQPGTETLFSLVFHYILELLSNFIPLLSYPNRKYCQFCKNTNLHVKAKHSSFQYLQS